MYKRDIEAMIEDIGIICTLEFIQETCLERAIDIEESQGSSFPARPWRKTAQIVKSAMDRIEREVVDV